MKNLAYRFQVFVLVLWIPCVMALFKVIAEKKLAALFTGAGFLILPALFLYSEFVQRRQTGRYSKLHAFISMEFLLLSSLPIFLLRVLNWNADFSTLSVMGIEANFLHRFSNTNYMILLASSSYLAFTAWRNEKSQPLG